MHGMERFMRGKRSIVHRQARTTPRQARPGRAQGPPRRRHERSVHEPKGITRRKESLVHGIQSFVHRKKTRFRGSASRTGAKRPDRGPVSALAGVLRDARVARMSL